MFCGCDRARSAELITMTSKTQNGIATSMTLCLIKSMKLHKSVFGFQGQVSRSEHHRSLSIPVTFTACLKIGPVIFPINPSGVYIQNKTLPDTQCNQTVRRKQTIRERVQNTQCSTYQHRLALPLSRVEAG